MTDAPTPALTLAAAEARAVLARERLHATLAQLQVRLDPRARIDKAKRDARIVGETAVAIAREQPAATGGIVAGTAIAAGVFLARHRIARAFAGKRADTPPSTAGLAPVTRTDP